MCQSALYRILLCILMLLSACQTTQNTHTPIETPYFLVIVFDIKHKEVFQDYQSLASRIKLSGDIIAWDNQSEVLEGNNSSKKGERDIQIIRFSSKTALLDFYNSNNFEALSPIRKASSKAVFYMVQGH